MTDYDFHSLSPVDFERLVCDVLRSHLGIDLKAFGHGPDGGVDLESREADGTSTVVQCKHYRGSSFSDLKKAAKLEKAKMDRLKPDLYYFVTSQNLSRTQQQAIVEALAPHLSDTASIYTPVELNRLLERFPDIELNHFKLWMASASVIRRIVHSGIWQRSEALMEEIQDRVRLYVTTRSFERARHMLDDKRVCVITGAPGVGKSMLADMLALAHWQDGWQIVELGSHEIGRAWDVLTPDLNQLIYFDDVFGQTDVHERLSKDNGVTVSRLINHVAHKVNKRLVITTRTHVLHEAESRDESVARAQLHARECVVEVDDYTRLHRAQILYNHLYFGDLPRTTLRDFVHADMYSRVIDHPNFTPRLIALSLQQHDDQPTAPALFDRLARTLDHPIDLWGASFREALSEPARMILLHLIAFPPHGAPHAELRAAAVRNATPIEYHRAIKQLEGSWIKLAEVTPHAGVVVTINNPSCRDFILSFIDSHPEYVADIVCHATDVAQISRLLGYAVTSTKDHEPKYPSLRQTVAQGASAIAASIREVGVSQRAADGAMSASSLSSLFDVSKVFDLRIESWIIEQALTLSAQVDSAENIEGRAAADLIRALVESERIPLTAAEVLSCKLMTLAWCEEVHASDEWDEVFDFSRWLEEVADFSWSKSDVDQIDRAFESWLESELEAILDNVKDLDEAESWVSDVRRVAHEYFGTSDFTSRFSKFDTDAEERFGNPYPPLYQSPYRGRGADAIASAQSDSPTARLLERLQASTQAATSARETEAREIRGMFDHLS